jgi:hypothetical protein
MYFCAFAVSNLIFEFLDSNSGAVNLSVFLGRGTALVCGWFMVFQDKVVSTDGGDKIIVLSKPLEPSLTYTTLHLRKTDPYICCGKAIVLATGTH